MKFENDEVYLVEGDTLNRMLNLVNRYSNITQYDKRDMENAVYAMVSWVHGPVVEWKMKEEKEDE